MPQLRIVPTKQLVIDPDVQLDFTLREHHWRAIALNWNPAAVGVLNVVPLDNDKYGIVDGRHRFLAGKSKGVAEWRVDVHLDVITRHQKAALKLNLDRDRRHVGALEHFMERVLAGHQDAVQIKQIAEDTGFTIGKSSGNPRQIESVTVLDMIYGLMGADGLRRTLCLNTKWIGEPKTNTRDWLSALGLLVRDGYDEVLTPANHKRLDDVVPAQLLRKAMGEAVLTGMRPGAGSGNFGAVSYMLASLLRKRARLRTRPVGNRMPKSSRSRPF